SEPRKGWPEQTRIEQPRHDTAFRSARQCERGKIGHHGQLVDMPVDRLVPPEMAAQPRGDTAGTARASGIDIGTRRQASRHTRPLEMRRIAEFQNEQIGPFRPHGWRYM